MKEQNPVKSKSNVLGPSSHPLKILGPSSHPLSWSINSAVVAHGALITVSWCLLVPAAVSKVVFKEKHSLDEG